MGTVTIEREGVLNKWGFMLAFTTILLVLGMCSLSAAITTNQVVNDQERSFFITATAAELARQGQAARLEAASLKAQQAQDVAENALTYRKSAVVAAWVSAGLAVVALGGGYSVQRWSHIIREIRAPLVREIGDGLQIVYPMVGQTGGPLLVDTVTGKTAPLYDSQAVAAARARVMERVLVARELSARLPDDWRASLAQEHAMQLSDGEFNPQKEM